MQNYYAKTGNWGGYRILENSVYRPPKVVHCRKVPEASSTGKNFKLEVLGNGNSGILKTSQRFYVPFCLI